MGMNTNILRNPLFLLLLFPFVVLQIACSDDVEPEFYDAAIQNAPSWLQTDLESKAITLLESTTQQRVEAWLEPLTRGCDAKYLDEIAYTLMCMPNRFITDDTQFSEFFPEWIIENAEAVYAMDSLSDDPTPFATLIERGNVKAGGDYYTTVLYSTGESGETDFYLDEALDRNAYYDWVVSPFVSTVLMSYSDTTTDSAGTAETGIFWRTYFPTYAPSSCPNATSDTSDDTPCPELKGSLSQHEVLWNGLVDTLEGNGAIGELFAWIRAHMVYDLGSADKNRICSFLQAQIGACGQYSTLGTTAGRAMLLPVRSVINTCGDHAWNEFYNGSRWVSFDTTKTARIDGGSNGPGYMYTIKNGDVIEITELYGDLGTIEATVLGADNIPLEGVLMKVVPPGGGGGSVVPPCVSEVTDDLGKVRFSLKAGSPYYYNLSYNNQFYPGVPEQESTTVLTFNLEANKTFRLTARVPEWSPTD
jgi:hypothetical protein